MKEARGMLKDILDRKVQLMDASGNVLTQRQAGIVKAWPDNTTADESEANDGGEIRIKMKQKF